MCHARDWARFDDRTQKKAEENRIAHERRVIDTLIKDANEQAAKAQLAQAPTKETAPAK